MNNSNGFQTGGIVLLAMSIVFCGLAFSLILPMIDSDNQPTATHHTAPNPSGTSNTVVPYVAESFAEFFSAGEPRQQSSTTSGVVVASSNSANTRPERRNRQFYSSTTQMAGTRNEPPTPTLATSSSLRTPPGFGSAEHYRDVAGHVEADATFVESTAATSQHRSVVSGSAGTFAPNQVPSGSVYAPVTVNLDSSLFAEQVKMLERRLHETEAQPKKIAQQTENSKRRLRNSRSKDRKRVDRDDELQKMGKNFEVLVKSFHELQAQTNQRLQEVASRSDQGQLASEVIESYKKALAMEKQHRELLLESTREAAATEIQKLASLHRQQLQAVQPDPSPVPQPVSLPPIMHLPKPLSLPSEQTSTDMAPTRTARAKTETISQSRRSPGPSPIRMQFSAPPTLSEESTEFSGTTSDHSIEVRRPKPVIQNDEKPQASLSIEDEEVLEVTSPRWQLQNNSQPEEVNLLIPLEAPAESDVSSLQSVPKPETASIERQVATPVAYANTYRFKMEVDSDGKNRVVPVNDNTASATTAAAVDQETSVQESTQPLVRQASAETENRSADHTEATTVTPAPLPNVKAPVKPLRDLRRDTRNAGRGMNRNFGTIRSTANETAADESAFLKLSLPRLSLPKLTLDKSKPGLLHRMSSTIRQIGRQVK